MNLLDRLIGLVAAEDMRSRVRAAIALGLLLCAIAAAASFFLFQTTQEISIEGTGRWIGGEGHHLEVVVAPAGLARIPIEKPLAVEYALPGDEPIRSTMTIVEIDPGAGTLTLSAPATPEPLPTGRFGIHLILLETRYGDLLWGKR